MSGEKSDNALIEVKVNQVLNLIIKGIYRTNDILRYVAEMDKLPKEERNSRGWVSIEKSERTIQEYIRRAKELLREQNMKDVKEIKDVFSAQLEDLYKLAIGKGQVRDANSIMSNKIHLHGLGITNVRGSFNVKTFDVPLSPELQKKYEESLEEFFGKDMDLKDVEEENGESDEGDDARVEEDGSKGILSDPAGDDKV